MDMKRILRDTALALALVAPLEGWLNVEWARLLAPRHHEYTADLARATPGKRVAFFGDSHPHSAFLNTPVPDSVANVSFGSESLRDIHVKLLTLLRRGVRLHTVVLQADPHVFSPYRETTNNEQVVVLGADVADYNAVYGRSLSGVKQLGMRVYPLSDVLNRNLLVSLLTAKYTRSAAAAQTESTPWHRLSAEARGRVADGRLLDQFGTGPFALSAVMYEQWKAILALCRQHGIRVVAIRYPVADEYLARLPRYDLRAVDELLRATPPDTILDYTTLYAGQTAPFTDSDHLGAAGSAAFGPRVFADLHNLPARRR